MVSNVNPQPDDPHIRLSHQLHREIIRRKFTARQRNVIDFILTLSWGCGKPSAIIPRLKDFSLCGVRPNHIRNELKILSEANVIFWDGAMNAFQLNKHYDQWQIEVVEDHDKKEMDKLISYNLEIKSPNLAKKLPEKGINPPIEEAEELPELGTNFPEREVETSRKGNFSLPKKGSRIVKIPHKIKVSRLSKESIKTIIKNTTTTTTTGAKDDYSFGNVFHQYHKNFLGGGKITEFDSEEFQALYDESGGEWLLKAMREAYRQGPDKRNLAYVGGVLKGYKERGGPEAQEKPPPPVPIDSRRNKQQKQGFDDLKRMREEAVKREKVGSN